MYCLITIIIFIHYILQCWCWISTSSSFCLWVMHNFLIKSRRFCVSSEQAKTFMNFESYERKISFLFVVIFICHTFHEYAIQFFMCSINLFKRFTRDCLVLMHLQCIMKLGIVLVKPLNWSLIFIDLNGWHVFTLYFIMRDPVFY